jgi:hypothetical protein
MSSMKVSAAAAALIGMLRDSRSEHRISALWALSTDRLVATAQRGRTAGEGRSKNLRVRRYALTVLRGAAETIQADKKTGGA